MNDVSLITVSECVGNNVVLDYFSVMNEKSPML